MLACRLSSVRPAGPWRVAPLTTPQDSPQTPRRTLSVRRRVLFAGLAFLSFFVLLELLLWGVAGVTYYVQVERFNPEVADRGDGRYRIVTFGDSVTAGQGTAPLYSYPRQLESLLNETNPGDRFEVINNGVYALNSSRLADLLPGWMEEFQPDLIVVMTGCNNAWNYRNSHLEELGLLEESERPRVLQLLDRTRTYRFLRVALKRRSSGFGIAEEQRHEPVLRDSMKISESVSPAVDGTARTLERQRQIFEDAEALDTLLEWDLASISQTARSRGAQVVMMTYPFQPPYQDHRGVTRRFAQEHSQISVDNYAVFQRMKQLRRDLDLFSADRGHPNATGYWSCAELFADQLLGAVHAKAAGTWRVEIDANGQVQKLVGTHLDQIQVAGGKVAFRARDEFLPAPRLGTTQPTARRLQVTGLPAGQYSLKIDGRVVARGSAAQWSKSRTLDNGPEFTQVERLRHTIIEKNMNYFRPQNHFKSHNYIYLI